MADKSPRQTSSKKSGKSLKEKRAEKKAKEDGKATARPRSRTADRPHRHARGPGREPPALTRDHAGA